jgi:hypothetical protein
MPLPLNVTKVMAGAGGAGPITLVEILARSGTALFISDQKIACNSWLNPAAGQVTYMPWLSSAVTIDEDRSCKSSTASFEMSNLAGDSVMRTLSRIASTTELAGALICVRIWLTASEVAIFTWLGKLKEPLDRGNTFSCDCMGFDNWSQIKAPPFHVGEICGLDFGSVNCGSTSSTPCNQNYGTCSSIERFQGVIIQWNGAALDYTQVAMPAQTVQMNNKRPF